MRIRLKILFIKCFAGSQKEADRKIVSFLSKEVFVKRKYSIDNLLKRLDEYERIKSKSEFKYLANIMQDELDLSNQRIIKDIAEMDNETKKLLFEYAPKEFKEMIRGNDGRKHL